jgi:hypothetical protein
MASPTSTPETASTDTAANAQDPSASATTMANEARKRMRTESERLISDAREGAESFASDQRDFAADYLIDLSDALGTAGTELSGRSRTSAAHVFHRAADETRRLADRVHGQDVGRVVGELETFARTRPTVFFGGAFMLGFVATRLLVAAARSNEAGDIRDGLASPSTHADTSARGEAR